MVDGHLLTLQEAIQRPREWEPGDLMHVRRS
jgi:hypothetical protein